MSYLWYKKNIFLFEYMYQILIFNLKITKHLSNEKIPGYLPIFLGIIINHYRVLY